MQCVIATPVRKTTATEKEGCWCVCVLLYNTQKLGFERTILHLRETWHPIIVRNNAMSTGWLNEIRAPPTSIFQQSFVSQLFNRAGGASRSKCSARARSRHHAASKCALVARQTRDSARQTFTSAVSAMTSSTGRNNIHAMPRSVGASTTAAAVVYVLLAARFHSLYNFVKNTH